MPTARARVDNAYRQLDLVREITARLLAHDGALLDTLARRGQSLPLPDGHRANTLGTQGGPGNTDDTPAEAAALRRAAANREDLDAADPVAVAIRDVFALTSELAGLARQLGRRLDFVEHVGASAGRHQQGPGGRCQACDTLVTGQPHDRLRAGYCNACRMAWERAGRPDRSDFEQQRRAETNTTP